MRKRRTGCVRWGSGRRARANRCRSVETRSDGIETGALGVAPGRVWRVPVYWPGGARHGGGASLVCGFHAEHGKADADTACPPCRGGRVRGSAPGGRNREALSTVAASAGGPARSSGEALVIRVDAKGPAHHWFVRASNRVSPGRRRVSRSDPESKPFQIPEQLVWE